MLKLVLFCSKDIRQYLSINTGYNMKSEFTAIIEVAPEGGYWAICPEVPGANGQGETLEEAKTSLREAIELIFEDRRSDILRGLPDDAIQEKVVIG
jgi:predicted RNase H-like HicB family nuclease